MKRSSKKILLSQKTLTSANYLGTLEALVPILKKGSHIANSLEVPFILTCAAGMEAMLNDDIVSWAESHFPEAFYKRIAEAHLSINLRGKLECIVPLMTNNDFVLRTNSSEYKMLLKLISRRNELMHSKSFYHFGEAEVALDASEDDMNSVREALSKKCIPPSDPFHTVTTNEALSYYEALKAFQTKFLFHLDDDSVIENDLVMRNPFQ